MAHSADVIYTGGWVFSALASAPIQKAVVVVDDRIAAVIAETDVESWTGDGTQLVDLGGGLLAPGFQDAHIHPIGGGVEGLQCNLTEARDGDEALELIAAYAAANPDLPWIQGAGWSMDHFPGGTPTRQMLDAIVSDRPVLLSNRDHHGAWANTLAFTLAGVDRTTPDPVDGRLERESDGTPAGTVHEGAIGLFEHVAPGTSNELAYAGLLRAQAELFALGVTGWQDAMVGTALGMSDSFEIYRRALAEGTLIAHVVGAQWWDRSAGIEQVEQMIARRDQVATEQPDLFSLGTVKIMVDGVAENQTAAMNAPYRDNHGHPTDNSGLSFIDPERLKEYVTALDAAGFQVHFHALGDRAVREALDAIEAARAANGPRGNRHHLAHLQVVDSADAARFAGLDAIANMQSLWASHEAQLDTLALPFLPDGAEEHHYPFGELLDQGARLAAGSDWPVSTANPIEAIHVAVNRVTPVRTLSHSVHPVRSSTSRRR